ncbi:hypothetical protein BH10CHL1_BH10CHL1_27390 [soil metagenome]
MTRRTQLPVEKPPILWTGILFALAANLLLVTVADGGAEQLQLSGSLESIVVIVGALLAGIFTAFYVRQRGGIHAFIGGVISIPLLGLLILVGAWQLAILAGAFCTLGGTISELMLRRGRTR